MYVQTRERETLGQELLQLHSAGYTYAELGKQFAISPNAAKGLIRTARLKRDRRLEVVHLGEPLDLHGNYIIVGDVHVPATDWAFASLVGRVADKTGIRRLIIGGDFFNLDLWGRFPQVVAQPTWREERDAARVLLHDWLEVFERFTPSRATTTAVWRSSPQANLTRQTCGGWWQRRARCTTRIGGIARSTAAGRCGA